MTSLFLDPRLRRPDAGRATAIVIGALYSPDSIAAATSALGRRALHIASADDIAGRMDDEAARVFILELGHPGFPGLCTRLSVGSCLPLVLLLPPTSIQPEELMILSRMAAFSIAHDHRELPSVLRRMMMHGTMSCDAHAVVRSVAESLPAEQAALAIGLYIAGSRNASVADAANRLGLAALRNRLRALRMAKASTILGWSSAINVVWRMEMERCSLAEAARAARFESARQCSDRVFYHTGRTPSVLRDQVGFAELVREFAGIVAPRISRLEECGSA